MLTRRKVGRLALVGAIVVFTGFAVAMSGWKTMAVGQEPAPPEGQTYMGAKACAACHFESYMSWRKTKHAKSYDQLPAKHKKNKECLQCHSTGFGEEGGFPASKDLAGTTCEACHGPGSQHVAEAKKLGNAKPTEAQETALRDLIWKVRPDNACAQCHLAMAHKEHPSTK